MTTQQHTPGPWSYNQDEGGQHGHVISTGEYIIADLPDAGDGAAPHTEANARLIAAAPELLEALADQTAAAQRVIDCWSQGDLAGAVNGLDCCLESSRHALARAAARC